MKTNETIINKDTLSLAILYRKRKIPKHRDILKRVVFILVFFSLIQKTTAQNKMADSLWQLIQTTKNNNYKDSLLWNLSEVVYSSVDEQLFYAKKEVAFGEKYNDKRCQTFGYILYARVYTRLGNYIKAQEAIAKASAIAETMTENGNYLTIIYNAKGTSENNAGKKFAYYKKGINACKSDFLKRILFFNVASAYLGENQVDSALLYAHKSNELSIRYHDTATIWMPLIFGQIYLKLNQADIAYAYFKKCLYFAEKSKIFNYYRLAYSGLISYFTAANNEDSVLKYQNKLFAFETPEAYPSKVVASEFIYQYYLKKGNKDSVIKYLLLSKLGNDSLSSTKKTEELQRAKLNEELRQKDAETAQAEERKNREHDIQLAITAIAVLCAVILFLLLSRSFIVHYKVVEFLSVVILLVVFEFINLLIHPFLEKVTHRSPPLMLLVLVAIAALLVPLHHRVEHWATQKLVEKNKAIRLAKAKKTIEELEKNDS